MMRSNSPQRVKALMDLSDIIKQGATDIGSKKTLKKIYHWNKKYRSKETYFTTRKFWRKIV